jgi:hypothetical protein
MPMKSAVVREGRAAAEVMGMLAEQERQRRFGMPTRAQAAREAVKFQRESKLFVLIILGVVL